ncbi:MAG: sigma-54 dependent transcriptional regulator [Pseudomonadota bacterium]
MDQNLAPAPSAAPLTEQFDRDLARARVLIVDDEPGMRNFLVKALRDHCGHVKACADTAEASAELDEAAYDVVILDNIMPKQSGLDWLAEQKRIGLFADAILITAYADLETAIAAIRAGASDFLLKPFRSNQVLNAIGQSLARSRLRRQNFQLRHELEAGKDLLRHRDALIGSSELVRDVRQAIARAADIPSHVIIRGEPGTGKQIAARMLHRASGQGERPFVWLQSFGMTEDTFQARLFGRVEDVSNGTATGEDGILINVAGGTVFLEDAEMLNPACQNILAELLSTGRFRPLGAQRSLRLDARVIASTTRPLQQAVEDGSFRKDLFYLLNVGSINLPPLRERAEDILELIAFFGEELSQRMGMALPALEPAMRRRLLAHPWPGNVMELRNTVERALIVGRFEAPSHEEAEPAEIETLGAVEQRHILKVLEACNGNRAEAARRLGVARKTIDRKCQSWGL